MGNVLILGSGGREHALAWKLKQSRHVNNVYVAPGNAGMCDVAETMPILDMCDFEAVYAFAKQNVGLTVVGPEAPLVDGIVDYFQERNIHWMPIFGPTKGAAMLEGSKIEAKRFMTRHNIPTADFGVFTDPADARGYVSGRDTKMVVKADGLAAGKGVYVCHDKLEAIVAIDQIMQKKKFGDAGNRIVIEDYLEGEEASILALTDGKTIKMLVSSQDHKPIGDGDVGKNTGGMGAYAPAPVVTDGVLWKTYNDILVPTIEGMADEGKPYTGCLYVGLKIDKQGNPKVVEFNCRFGDPETQVVLPLVDGDLFELMIACTNSSLHKYDIRTKSGAACCVVMASGGYPNEYKKGFQIRGLNQAKTLPNVEVFHAGTGFDSPDYFTAGGRVLGVTGFGDRIANAMIAAYQGVEQISWHNEYHRRDIGAKGLER
ncbi:MAG: phosphoribosylamine--glycine ligase [Nanoarchaeota archaeon]|nr:phosphoribosylamine--glycine ligase [Nanoarchaeota archaeon]MBU1975252.1 phosphoribosylamine--glycine ligase [Nanoarchaeota archaeon]